MAPSLLGLLGLGSGGGLVIWHNSLSVTNLRESQLKIASAIVFLNMWCKWVGNHLQEELSQIGLHVEEDNRKV
jgi:hypothetical protein